MAVGNPVNAVDKSTVSAGWLSRTLAGLTAQLATQRCRTWLWWAGVVPPSWRRLLVPGWTHVFMLHHWVHLEKDQRAPFASAYLSEPAGRYVRALQRGRSLTWMLKLVEGSERPSAEIVSKWAPTLTLVPDEAEMPLKPGPVVPGNHPDDFEGDGKTLSEKGKERVAKVLREQEATYNAALEAWELKRAEAERMNAAATADLTWRTIASATVGIWSALGVMPEGVIE